MKALSLTLIGISPVVGKSVFEKIILQDMALRINPRGFYKGIVYH
ncbi:MAG: hypothetical protein NZ901_05895 [Geminocystis sp.]|nr:hypothetical protein [Geminocystis sp.]MCS7147709.1 hypothetical protein [Geminocystis sp.]MCX8079270.1 hypothetical protein [Geminocystis sp.]MDW8116716.1 hypothetical protein [Geminocystis sp.]MDW8463878.1 hypothetical protein [Geminocystis sp.]